MFCIIGFVCFNNWPFVRLKKIWNTFILGGVIVLHLTKYIREAECAVTLSSILLTKWRQTLILKRVATPSDSLEPSLPACLTWILSRGSYCHTPFVFVINHKPTMWLCVQSKTNHFVFLLKESLNSRLNSSVSNLFHLWLQPASLVGVVGCSQKYAMLQL